MDIFHRVELDGIRDQVAEILRVLTALDQKITNYQIKGENFMSSAAQALIDLKNAANTIVVAQTNLAAGIAALQAADAAIDAALLALEAKLTGSGVSAADVEAVVAQLQTASTALAAGISSVGTVTADLNTQVANAGITVVVTPATATVAQGGTQQFSATGDPAGYVWSLNPASGEGMIDQTGLFTAPTGQDGTAQVIATSKTNSTKAGSAAVTF